MARTPNDPGGDTREARLKAALRANLGRRKAQGRARTPDGAAAGIDTNEQHGHGKPQQGSRPEDEE